MCVNVSVCNVQPERRCKLASIVLNVTAFRSRVSITGPVLYQYEDAHAVPRLQTGLGGFHAGLPLWRQTWRRMKVKPTDQQRLEAYIRRGPPRWDSVPMRVVLGRGIHGWSVAMAVVYLDCERLWSLVRRIFLQESGSEDAQACTCLSWKSEVHVCAPTHDIDVPRNSRSGSTVVWGSLSYFGGSESISCSFLCITEGVVARPGYARLFSLAVVPYNHHLLELHSMVADWQLLHAWDYSLYGRALPPYCRKGACGWSGASPKLP